MVTYPAHDDSRCEDLVKSLLSSFVYSSRSQVKRRCYCCKSDVSGWRGGHQEKGSFICR